MLKDHWKWLAAIGVGVGILAYAKHAGAADLGGNCCSDLEERIAELEATTARKGTKKTSLTIYGQVNKSILYYDVEDFSDTAVLENGASETFVGFSARMQISKDWFAGGVIELGQGKSGLHLNAFPPSAAIETDNGIYTRQSYVFVSSPAGKVSVGLQSMATDDLTHVSIAETTAATKRLTLHPIGGIKVSLGPITLVDLELEPFNGQKANAVRYDSPVVGGFSASAAWESASDSWDAALRYAGEFSGFAVMAAVGFESDKADDLLSFFADVETETLSANGGVKHITSGLFVQGSWARYEIVDLNGETDVWHVQAGIERKLFDIGPTTVWGGVMQWDDLDFTSYELGLNQNIGGGADAYILGKTYEVDDVDAMSVLGGLRVRF